MGREERTSSWLVREHSEFNMRDAYRITWIYFHLFVIYLPPPLRCRCMCRYVHRLVCTVRLSIQTLFSTGHLTHFSEWITRLQPIIGRQNSECWKRLHPACHMSESQPCLSTERGRDGERGGGLILLSPPPYLPSLSLHISTTQGPVKLQYSPPTPAPSSRLYRTDGCASYIAF